MPSRRLLLLSCIITCYVSAAAHAADSPWVNISDHLIARLTADGKKPVWPGETAGVAVDRTTGNLFLVVPGDGLFKSTDRGVTFARCDDGKVTGRCETAYALHLDPATSRMACFMLDGKCAMSLDAGQTWHPFKDVGRNWDYAAVDWSTEKPQVIFGARHESGGESYVSTDAGVSWTMLAKEKAFDAQGAVGVVDANPVLPPPGDGLHRSTDQGKTWTKVSDFTPVSHVMQTFNGAHYFFAVNHVDPAAPADPKKKKPATYESFLIVSKDKGATWTKQGVTTDAAWGPYFGKDDKHLITVGKKSAILESTDAGETWKEVVALPPKGFDTNRAGWFTNLAYDPKSDTFYISRMGQPAFKYERK
ncbi:MAG: BNR/Asp-box repeat protein [Phycisphaerales bacterium]|nr:BNR/Asp-box repeat protein [Phycisphaerales bacterium]